MRLGAEGFAALGAFVRLHGRVEPLVLQKLKAVLEAATTQWAVVSQPSSGVARFERSLPQGQQRRSPVT